MSDKKNKYEKLAKLKELDSPKNRAQAPGSVKQTSIETGKDVLFGAVIGGVTGGLINKPLGTFFGGLVVTGIGHYMGSTSTSAFGLGLMTSATTQGIDKLINSNSSSSSNSSQTSLEGISERFQALKAGLLQLVKNKKNAKKDESTNGVGEVQYFVYPNKELEGSGELDLSALDNIERQIAQSGESYSKRNSMGMLSADNEMGEIDLNERNY